MPALTRQPTDDIKNEKSTKMKDTRVTSGEKKKPRKTTKGNLNSGSTRTAGAIESQNTDETYI